MTADEWDELQSLATGDRTVTASFAPIAEKKRLDAEVKQLREEVARLRAELAALRPLAEAAVAYYYSKDDNDEAVVDRVFEEASNYASDPALNPRYTHPAVKELRERGYKRINDPRSEAGRWVPVTERLPGDIYMRLLRDEHGNVAFGAYKDGGWVSTEDMFGETTHWCELPPEPA